MSVIDAVEIDQDIDGNNNVVTTLILHGDFVSACEDYLDPDGFALDRLRLQISHGVAEDLIKELSKYL
jgi:hypothetical protein